MRKRTIESCANMCKLCSGSHTHSATTNREGLQGSEKWVIVVPRITSCCRDVWSQKIALRECCLHFFVQVQTWNPPEGENHVDGQAWAGLSLWRCFLELTNFLWLHAAMVAIEATDWLDSNCMLQTFVLLSPRHPWSHDFQCTWAYKCSVWHTHAGKMSLPCLYKFKQNIRKTVKVTQLHIWFLQNLRIADLLIPFKFHECLEAMLATFTPASLGCVCVSFSNHGIENQFLPGSDCSGSWRSQIYTCAQDCSDYLRLDICCGNAIRRADACMYANSWDEKPQLNVLIEHPRALEAFHLSHMQANHEQIFPWIPATTPAVGTSSRLQAATVTKHFGTR